MTSPGGSRYDACMFDNLRRVGALTGTRSEPDNAQHSLRPGPGQEGIGRTGHNSTPLSGSTLPIATNGRNVSGWDQLPAVHPTASELAVLGIPGERAHLVEVCGATPEGDYLVAWHEMVAGFFSRKSMTVRPEWIGR
jgi:hypothetical protein